jgi:hypothetical protein
MTSNHLNMGAEPTTAALYISNVLIQQKFHCVQHNSDIVNKPSDSYKILSALEIFLT